MLVRRAIELFAPAECLSCGLEGVLICASCLDNLASKRRGVCYRCNRLSEGGRTCRSCDSSSSLTGVTVGAYYDGAIKDLILGLKFHRSISAAETGAELILRQGLPTEQVDLVTAVPISPARYRERGYNQAELIAKTVARTLGKPYRSTMIRSSSDHQLGKSRRDRLYSVQGSFVATKNLKGLKVLIVDDVLTTGATLNESALVLRSAGAGRVWGAVVARH